MQRPTVSVNIAVKDRRDLVAACLDGLGAQSIDGFEVVVVDNDSTDGTLELLQDRAARADGPFRMRVLTSNGSLGAVRNAGLAASTGEIVAFVDSDCVPTPAWLAEGLALFGDADVSTVQGKTLPDPSKQRGSWDATQELTSFTRRYEACNLFYRREALLKAGGFDEQIGFFGEDSMAGWAVRRLGMQERFAPAALVHHAVTHPGIRWHWRRGLRYANWNKLIRRFPEMREICWGRFFLRARSAATFALFVGVLIFVVGVALDWLVPALIVGPGLAASFLWRNRPLGFSRQALKEAIGAAGFDIAVELALLWGSIRERTLVL